MSHFTLLITGGDDLVNELPALLAPYDENVAVEPYRDYFEDTPETFWATEALRKEGLLPEGEITWAQLSRAFRRKYPDSQDAILVDAGDPTRAYSMSTYNPESYGIVCCLGAEGSEGRQSTGHEVLLEVSANEAGGGVLRGSSSARRSVHVVHSLHESTEQGANPGAAAGLDSAHQVRDQHAGIRRPAGESGRGLRDLPSDAEFGSLGAEEGPDALSGGGPLSSDGSDTWPPVCPVQHDAGPVPGQHGFARCGNRLHHDPHLLRRDVIGGSKWDWWTIGGRWTGYFDVQPGVRVRSGVDGGWLILGESGAFGNSPEPGKVDGGRKRLLDFESMRERKAGEARLTYRRAALIIGRHGMPDTSWASGFGAPGFKEGRAAFWNHPTVKAMQADAVTSTFPDVDEIAAFATGESAYVGLAIAGAVPGYALLHEGRWIAPGRMGWFGASSDSAAERIGYLEVANTILDGLDDDAMVVVADLHI